MFCAKVLSLDRISAPLPGQGGWHRTSQPTGRQAGRRVGGQAGRQGGRRRAGGGGLT
jgi:hypothetical protein